MNTSDRLDAARVLEACARRTVQDGGLPLREFSARLFRDSKRVEKLAVELDVRLCGSIESQPRAPAQVWQELGLLPQEHPVLRAGRVQIDRGRVIGLLDAPYTGLSAASIHPLLQPSTPRATSPVIASPVRVARLKGSQVVVVVSVGLPPAALISASVIGQIDVRDLMDAHLD